MYYAVCRKCTKDTGIEKKRRVKTNLKRKPFGCTWTVTNEKNRDKWCGIRKMS